MLNYTFAAGVIDRAGSDDGTYFAMRIAIIGSGIAGLTSAHLLSRHHDVTVFEIDSRPGGHAHTVDVTIADETHAVDTGFIVYNERNYPGLTRLFAHLGVATSPSDMSFSVSDPRHGLEWRSSTLNTVFAQRRNLLRRDFVTMLADIGSFNRQARKLLTDGRISHSLSLREMLEAGPWSERLREWYLAPMVSAIWSAPMVDALDIPAATFARFFDNHGLLSLGDRPHWRTVVGGSRAYVEKIAAPLGRRLRVNTSVSKVTRRRDGVEVTSDVFGPETFDHVVLATHSDQSLALLSDPSEAEREILGAIRYQPSAVVLHTDETLLPRSRRAWASWNYRLGVDDSAATVTYHMNQLQSIPSRHQILVSLNQTDRIDAERILGEFDYSHPVLDAGAIAAQRRVAEIDGRRGTWFAGAYWGYGFHEDGLQSALRVCRHFGVEL